MVEYDHIIKTRNQTIAEGIKAVDDKADGYGYGTPKGWVKKDGFIEDFLK
jgi:hypothetical protein